MAEGVKGEGGCVHKTCRGPQRAGGNVVKFPLGGAPPLCAHLGNTLKPYHNCFMLMLTSARPTVYAELSQLLITLLRFDFVRRWYDQGTYITVLAILCAIPT